MSRGLEITAHYDPPISGAADQTALEMWTAGLTSDQSWELCGKIEELVKSFHLENGLEWESE